MVIDDLMQELSNDPRITSFFTKGCHHRNLTVIFILQNIFYRGKELRGMSLNCHYLVLFKSLRDSSQINHLAKQMFPGRVKYIFFLYFIFLYRLRSYLQYSITNTYNTLNSKHNSKL